MMFGSYTIRTDVIVLDGGYRDATYIAFTPLYEKKPANLGTLGSLGTRCVASILVDGLSVLHLNW